MLQIPAKSGVNLGSRIQSASLKAPEVKPYRRENSDAVLESFLLWNTFASKLLKEYSETAPLNKNDLMTIASKGAFLISVWIDV